MKINFCTVSSQLYITPYVKITYDKSLNGDYELIVKQDPYSQGKLILEVLKRGGEYFEEEASQEPSQPITTNWDRFYL